jgi:hypothetical protein
MAQTVAPSTNAAEAMPTHRVVIDAITGRVRMPEPSEMPAAAAAPSGAGPNASSQAYGQAAGKAPSLASNRIRP